MRLLFESISERWEWFRCESRLMEEKESKKKKA